MACSRQVLLACPVSAERALQVGVLQPAQPQRLPCLEVARPSQTFSFSSWCPHPSPRWRSLHPFLGMPPACGATSTWTLICACHHGRARCHVLHRCHDPGCYRGRASASDHLRLRLDLGLAIVPAPILYAAATAAGTRHGAPWLSPWVAQWAGRGYNPACSI